MPSLILSVLTRDSSLGDLLVDMCSIVGANFEDIVVQHPVMASAKQDAPASILAQRLQACARYSSLLVLLIIVTALEPVAPPKDSSFSTTIVPVDSCGRTLATVLLSLVSQTSSCPFPFPLSQHLLFLHFVTGHQPVCFNTCISSSP